MIYKIFGCSTSLKWARENLMSCRVCNTEYEFRTPSVFQVPRIRMLESVLAFSLTITIVIPKAFNFSNYLRLLGAINLTTNRPTQSKTPLLRCSSKSPSSLISWKSNAIFRIVTNNRSITFRLGRRHHKLSPFILSRNPPFGFNKEDRLPWNRSRKIWWMRQ